VAPVFGRCVRLANWPIEHRAKVSSQLSSRASVAGKDAIRRGVPRRASCRNGTPSSWPKRGSLDVFWSGYVRAWVCHFGMAPPRSDHTHQPKRVKDLTLLVGAIGIRSGVRRMQRWLSRRWPS